MAWFHDLADSTNWGTIPSFASVSKATLCMFMSVDTGSENWGNYVGNQSGDNGFFYARYSNTYRVQFSARNGTNVSGVTTAALSPDTLYHTLMSFDGDGANNDARLQMFINGTKWASTFTGTIPSATSATQGNFLISWPSGAFRVKGTYAEVAVWIGRAIRDPAITAALANGISPLAFPDGLEFYAPMVRDRNDVVMGRTANTVGSPIVVAHPAARKNPPPMWVPAPAAAPAATPALVKVYTGKRDGWPHGHPPNGPFVLNRTSPQARGLVEWWPTIPSRSGQTLPSYTGGRPFSYAAGTINPAVHPEAGVGLDFIPNSQMSLTATGYTMLPAGGHVSVSLWIVPDTTPPVIQDFLRMHEASSGKTVLLLGQHTGGGGGYLGLWGDGDTGYKIFTNSDPVVGVLHHLVFTATGILRTDWKLYVNGVADTTGLGGASSSTARTPDGDWLLGGQTSRYFDGRIFDIRIYNRALSAAEVAALYNPATRWELYQPATPAYIPVGVAAAPEPPTGGLLKHPGMTARFQELLAGLRG